MPPAPSSRTTWYLPRVVRPASEGSRGASEARWPSGTFDPEDIDASTFRARSTPVSACRGKAQGHAAGLATPESYKHQGFSPPEFQSTKARQTASKRCPGNNEGLRKRGSPVEPDRAPPLKTADKTGSQRVAAQRQDLFGGYDCPEDFPVGIEPDQPSFHGRCDHPVQRVAGGHPVWRPLDDVGPLRVSVAVEPLNAQVEAGQKDRPAVPRDAQIADIRPAGLAPQGGAVEMVAAKQAVVRRGNEIGMSRDEPHVGQPPCRLEAADGLSRVVEDPRFAAFQAGRKVVTVRVHRDGADRFTQIGGPDQAELTIQDRQRRFTDDDCAVSARVGPSQVDQLVQTAGQGDDASAPVEDVHAAGSVRDNRVAARPSQLQPDQGSIRREGPGPFGTESPALVEPALLRLGHRPVNCT